MTIVNTTFVINNAIAPEVVAWIRRVYERSAIQGGATGPGLLTRVIGNVHADADAESYAVHFTFPTIEQATAWNDGLGASVRALLHNRWGDRALAFTTYLEVVQ